MQLNKPSKQNRTNSWMPLQRQHACQKAGSSTKSGSFLEEGLRAGPLGTGRPRAAEGHAWEEPTVPDTSGHPGLHRPRGWPRPAFLRMLCALPDTRSKWASFLSPPPSLLAKGKNRTGNAFARVLPGWTRGNSGYVFTPPPAQCFLGSAQGPGPAAASLTLQRECVRCRGELMSLGVDDRSPSAADASEMTEGCREWQGLTLTAGRQGQLVNEGWRGQPHLSGFARGSTQCAHYTEEETETQRNTLAQLCTPPLHSPTCRQRAAARKNLPHSFLIRLVSLLTRVKERKRQFTGASVTVLLHVPETWCDPNQLPKWEA